MSGFKIEDDFQEQWEDIQHYIGSIQDKLEDDNAVKACLREIGNCIKKAVKQYAPKRSQNPSYSDSGKGNYKHIVDDITYNVKKSRSSGQYYVSVHGGKWTGYKWLWVNDGHVATNGTKVPGNHFIDKAEKASEKNVQDIVDKYIKSALEKDK